MLPIGYAENRQTPSGNRLVEAAWTYLAAQVMPSQEKIVDHILSRIAKAGTVSARKMFGEYTIYCDRKVVALVCDDRLFVKPTEAGRKHIGDVEEAPPYKGAKACFVVSEDMWDDARWMTTLFRLTTAEQPAPKPKKTRRTR